MSGRIVFRIFLGLLVIALLAGAGVNLYHLGVAHGLAMAPQLDRLPQGAPLFPYAPYGPWGFRPYGWGFGFAGFFFRVLFFFGIVWLVSRIFFWGRWGGGWGGRGLEQRRQMFEEWHRRAHGWGPNEGPQQQSPSPHA